MKHPKKYNWLGYRIEFNGSAQYFHHNVPGIRLFKSIQEAVPGCIVVLKLGSKFIVGQVAYWNLVGTEEEFLKRARYFKDEAAAEMCARMM